MSGTKHVAITEKLQANYGNTLFCNEVVNRINEDYPNCARIIIGRKKCWVEITLAHYVNCINYVQKNCKIKANYE